MKNGLFGVLLILALILFTPKAGAQEGINVSAGLNIPELMNLGLRVQFNKLEVGVTVGTDAFTDDKSIALSTGLYYHFGGSSEFTELPPWFVKTGFTYLRYENDWKRNTTYMLVPVIGREFNISTKFGIALEAGILFILYDHEETLMEDPYAFFVWDLDFTGFVLPSGGVSFYYRL